MNGTFDGLDSWSGLLIQVRDGDHLMFVNPAHSHTRRTLTIAHEFGHLALGHRPIIIENDVGMRENRYSDAQEREATPYGASLLLPYAPLLQMLHQGAPMHGIAYHYGVSVAAVDRWFLSFSVSSFTVETASTNRLLEVSKSRTRPLVRLFPCWQLASSRLDESVACST